jgi:hypothetical protein
MQKHCIGQRRKVPLHIQPHSVNSEYFLHTETPKDNILCLGWNPTSEISRHILVALD